MVAREDLNALEARLVATERDLQAMRERMQEAEQRERRAHRLSRSVAGGGLLALAACLFVVGIRPGESQSSLAKPGFHRVRTPFVVMDNANRVVMRVESDRVNGGLLELFDGKGNSILEAGAGGDARGILVRNPAGVATGLFGAGPGSGEVVLRDNAGAVVFQAP